MRIVSYNVLALQGFPQERGIAACGGSGTEANAKHFTDVFHGFAADIIALQEGVAAQDMQKIAQYMGYNLSTATSPTAFPGHVLTKYPILESRTFSHVNSDAGPTLFSRTCGATLLKWNDDLLWIVNVHLHPKERDTREQEAVYLSQILKGLLPVTENIIVLGDFNSPIEEPIHQNLRALNFINAVEQCSGLAPTMDNFDRKTLCIDHIYVCPAMSAQLSNAVVYRQPGFYYDQALQDDEWVHSDHMPVVADFDC